MKGWTWRKVLTVGLAAVVVIWLLAVGMTFALSSFLDKEETAHLGAAGDMFGASAALFGGLGFLGLVIVLYFDIGERRKDLLDRQRARRPFLVPVVTPQGATLSQVNWMGAHLQVGITVLFEISNATDEPALNLQAESSVRATDHGVLTATPSLTDLPVAARQQREVSIFYSATGQAALEVMKALASGAAVTVPIKLKYMSLNGTPWTSSVEYLLSARRPDLATLSAQLDPQSGRTLSSDASYVAAAEDALVLEARSVAGSWSQTPE